MKSINLKIFTLSQILGIGTQYLTKRASNIQYSAKFGTRVSPNANVVFLADRFSVVKRIFWTGYQFLLSWI